MIGKAQDCSDIVNITVMGQQVLVNRSIPQSCLQCLDSDLSISDISFWTVRTIAMNDIGLFSNSGVIDGFENVDGVLVLGQPMQLLGDGATNFITVSCSGPQTFYAAISVYSSGMYSYIAS